MKQKLLKHSVDFIVFFTVWTSIGMTTEKLIGVTSYPYIMMIGMFAGTLGIFLAKLVVRKIWH